MYMTLVYVPRAGSTGPEQIHVKYNSHDGPDYGVVTWDPAEMSVSIRQDKSCILSGPVALNGSHGIAAYAMQGATILFMDTPDGAPVEIRSAAFSQKPGRDGFAAYPRQGKFPAAYDAGTAPGQNLVRYFAENKLFCSNVEILGGLYGVWFDDDTPDDTIRGFLDRHPNKTLGIFGTALSGRQDPGSPPSRRCYMFASYDHANVDLAQWRSQDRSNGLKPGPEN